MREQLIQAIKVTLERQSGEDIILNRDFVTAIRDSLTDKDNDSIGINIQTIRAITEKLDSQKGELIHISRRLVTIIMYSMMSPNQDAVQKQMDKTVRLYKIQQAHIKVIEKQWLEGVEYTNHLTSKNNALMIVVAILSVAVIGMAIVLTILTV